MPVGPLMIEHRLIERMVKLMTDEFRRLEAGGEPDPVFLRTAADFIRTYADRTHHGKEEDILFRELEKRDLSDEHRQTMNRLIEDHKTGRKATGGLAAAVSRFEGGGGGAVDDIRTHLRTLAELYPPHIETEDKRFFIPVMEYFTDEEKDAMLEEEYEFDRNMIHEKYRQTVEGMEQSG